LRAFPALAAPVFAVLAIAGCSQPRELYVSDAWVRLPAVPGRPAAAYFTLHGGATDATLIGVSTDVAIKTELHETKDANGAMTMAPLPSLAVPARSAIAFAPGGRHVMLFDLNPAVKKGGALTLTFSFSNGLRIQQDASVIAAGDPAPKS
jgi:periplasmic copper chaperone A